MCAGPEDQAGAGDGVEAAYGMLRFHGLKSADRRSPAVRTIDRGLADAPPLLLPGYCRSGSPDIS